MFVIYQVTDELRRHALPLFQRAESEYCLLNFPPYFIISFHKGQKDLAGVADERNEWPSRPPSALIRAGWRERVWEA